MQQAEILEIEDRVKRVSHRVKNAGATQLFKKGISYAKRIKVQSCFETAALLEVEYLTLLRKEYLPSLPVKMDTTLSVVSMSDGYDDSDNEDDNDRSEDDTSEDSDDTDAGRAPASTGDSGGNESDDDSDDSDFDVDASATAITNNAADTYGGKCAAAVRGALEAGGLDTTGHPEKAKDYGDFLEDNGFSSVPDAKSAVANPEKGDIVVIQPSDKDSKPHPSGHIAMYDGQQWVSDAKQRDYSAGLKGDFKVYRPD